MEAVIYKEKNIRITDITTEMNIIYRYEHSIIHNKKFCKFIGQTDAKTSDSHK
jgi:hypothetical protein